MFKLKTLITPIAVCITLALANQAFAKPEHGRNHHKMAKVFSQLSLTDAQKQDIKQIFKQGREDHHATGFDFRPIKQELGALVHTSEWDQAAIEAVILQNQAKMAQAGLQRAQNKHAVLNLLTDDQRNQLSEIVANGKDSERRDKKRQLKAKGKGKTAKKLGLTEDQIASMKTLKSENKESAMAIVEKLKLFKQAERSLISSADFNEESWLALSSEYKDEFLAMAILKAKSKHDMWNVLTPEQQTVMQSRSKKGKGFKKGMKGKKRHSQES